MKLDFDALVALTPSEERPLIDWEGIWGGGLGPHAQRMSQTPQDPEWHGEGDVWTHTRLVCEALVSSDAWRALDRRRRSELFLAALLHDVGKPARTHREDGRWVSPGHASTGARAARAILWRDLGVAGSSESQRFRETVCALVQYHATPFHFLNEADPERRAVQLASLGDLAPDFSLSLLSALAEADTRGRVSDDLAPRLEQLRFFEEVSAEAGCLNAPLEFPSPFSRYAYLSGRNVAPGQPLYDDTWGTVVMLSGLPATGKDTYIRQALGDLPMVSLDEIRLELRVSPEAAQDRVVSAARDRARELLRQKQPFIWNATDLTPMVRRNQIELFIGYGASVEVRFLETGWEESLRRNSARPTPVPQSAVEQMLQKMSPPTLTEAHRVRWSVT